MNWSAVVRSECPLEQAGITPRKTKSAEHRGSDLGLTPTQFTQGDSFRFGYR